jgi:hypothetical protein
MNVISAIFLATAVYGLYKRKWSALFFVVAAFLCSCEHTTNTHRLPCDGLKAEEVGMHGVPSTICGCDDNIDTLKLK